jgi:hypothetical protein
VGLALAVRIHEAYGSVEEDDIHALDLEADEPDEAPSDKPKDLPR